MDTSVIFLFIVPAVLALLFYLFLKIYYKDNNSVFIKYFLFGLLCVLLVMLTEYLAKVTQYNRLLSLRRLVFYSFFVIGFFSEFGKFIILNFISHDKKNYSMLFYIACSIMITLGFVTTRNVQTFYTSDNYNLFYAFLYIPMNIVFAIIMGYYVGIGSLRKNLIVDSLTGLLFASFFHGLFIMCILIPDKKLLILTCAGASIISLILMINAFRIKLKGKVEK